MCNSWSTLRINAENKDSYTATFEAGKQRRQSKPNTPHFQYCGNNFHRCLYLPACCNNESNDWGVFPPLPSLPLKQATLHMPTPSRTPLLTRSELLSLLKRFVRVSGCKTADCGLRMADCGLRPVYIHKWQRELTAGRGQGRRWGLQPGCSFNWKQGGST